MRAAPRLLSRPLAVSLCLTPFFFAHVYSAADLLDVPKSLLATWTFDETSPDKFLDHSGHACHASPAGDGSGVTRVKGPFDGALLLSAGHNVQVRKNLRFAGLSQISFSVWVRPSDLSGYREIFRKEDGDRRVLFSFQHGGTVLSLGLNVHGYVECDAQIDPALLLDGAWHHCAATFDGRRMTVYLDGKPVGSTSRVGEIRAGGAAPGCIGSSDGGECFHGWLDELSIFGQALTGEEVSQLSQRGVDALARHAQQCEQTLQAIYAPKASLAETLAACRKSLWEKGLQHDTELARLVPIKLRADFPEPYEQLVSYLRAMPGEYLLAPGNEFHLREVGRLVELMMEYQPLTDGQWQRLTADDRENWQAAEIIKNRFEGLKAEGESARFSPEWVRLALEAGRRIQFRPYLAEAVAPYLTPHTPEIRSLTAADARQALQRDWLHQADGGPTSKRIGQEIQWARQLIARLQAQRPGAADFSGELAELRRLQQQALTLSGPNREVYFQVREVKRQVAFKNRAVDFDKLLLVDMPFPQGSEWPHETRHRLGYMAVPGGRLLILEGLSPAGQLKQLMPQSPLHGSFWRPDLSYDGKTVLFCFKPHNEKAFHLYEMNVDGTGLVQLTDGPYDDLDPVYLPDNQHIIFSTTRGHTYVRCMPPTSAYVMARCDRDGQDIYLISRNNEPDYLPSVMHDGRIIYTRWEYTDKPLWRAQGLWTVNPDGTQVNTYWGNQSVWPDLLKDARSIPGSSRVMFTGSAHHDWFSGSVGIIDPNGGFNFPNGLTKVTADVAWPESGDGPVDPIESTNYHASGQYRAYYSPYPLSEKDFLVSANRDGKFVLYLMDTDGNRELIYEGVNQIFHAIPLKPRERPPVIPDRVDWPARDERLNPQAGVIFSNNVYDGASPRLVGQARYLRVMNIEHKTYTYWHKRPYISTGPVVSAIQSEGVKRVLGTVPIERDGSVAFHAPAGIPLHFQLLDDDFRALQTMRSFTGVMPGERRGCTGCHESHSASPQVRGSALALTRDPSPITPPPWGHDSVSFERYVQPVLNEYCGSCHQGNGEAREVLDLTARPGFLIFSEPYMLLTGRPSWGQPYVKPNNAPPGFGIANTILVEGYDQRDPQAYQTPEPMTRLSYRSALIEIASSGDHYDVRVDPVSRRRLIAWIDTMCPYRGDQEVRALDDPVFQGIDWLSVRPTIKSAPTIVRPGPVDD